jgi:hypothetical protein
MMSFTGAAHLLAPGGVLHSLGNAGPLGPLGIAGMLGPNGAHGYARNALGDYVDRNRKIVRSITIKSHEGRRRFDLYELYHLDKLRSQEALDTSFALRGVIRHGQSITLTIVSKSEQWVNLLVVNEYELDSFSLKVKDQKEVEVVSNSQTLSNFISVKVTQGTRLQITVSHQSSLHFLNKPFRLYVTGSEGARDVSRGFHKLTEH